jgi:hypothetical protein
VVISSDISNAFNTCSRSHTLSTLFESPSLSPIFRLAHWSYGTTSPLLLMDRGRIAAQLLSCEGVRQGDALASLLCALSLRSTYSSSIDGLDCHAVAVMDDFYIFGPADGTFTGYDRFLAHLPNINLTSNLSKSNILLNEEYLTNGLINNCTSRHLPYSTISIAALGSILTRDSDIFSDWLVEQVKNIHEPFFKLLLDPRLPSQHAFTLLRNSMVPRMNYFSRTTPPPILVSAARDFDRLVVDTFCRRMALPAITDEARLQLQLPVREGGFGLSSVQAVSPSAWYSAFANSFSRICPF